MMDTLHTQLTELFKQAGAAHHEAFADVNGADPDWPGWYAEHVLAGLNHLLQHWFTAPQLAQELAQLADRHQREAANQPWPEFYAAHFLHHYTPNHTKEK